MKIALLFLGLVLLILGGGYAWHLHNPIPFFSGNDEKIELPGAITPFSPEEGQVETKEEDASKNQESEEEAMQTTRDNPGNEGEDFSIEIIDGEEDTGPSPQSAF